MATSPIYNLDNFVSFMVNDIKYSGYVVAIMSREYGNSYCIFDESYGNDTPGTMLMEERDLTSFIRHSKKFDDNIGKRAFWIREDNILSVRKNDGEKCYHCKEFYPMAEKNFYFRNGVTYDFACFLCRQDPHR